VHHSKLGWLMSQLGQKRTSGHGHTDKAARRLCPTSLPRNVGSSYSEEPGVEIL